jgi:hypothetical protein
LDHTGETPVTIPCADGTQTPKVPLEICQSGNFCGAKTLWDIPEKATAKAYCIKNPDPVPTPDKSVLPGDICQKDTECFYNDRGVKCTSGKCVSAVKPGDDCKDDTGKADSNVCPENHYCDTATIKCVAALAIGADCTQPTPCKTGLGCIGNADGSKYT